MLLDFHSLVFATSAKALLTRVPFPWPKGQGFHHALRQTVSDLCTAPVFCCLDKISEEPSRVLVVIEISFRMPLNGEDIVIGRSAFQGFYHAILRTTSHNAQTIAGNVRGLMMTGVNFDQAVFRAGEFLGQH